MLATRPWRLPATALLTIVVLQIVAPALAERSSAPLQLAQQSADLEEAEHLNQQGVRLYEQGHHAEAESFYQRALTIWEKALGPNHPDVATSLNNLAVLYKDQGNYAKAETFHQRALAIKEKALGPNHPDVASSLNNLAVLYKDQGNYAEAEPLHQRALVIKEKALGPNHPDVATSLHNLAGLYQDQGNYAEAEPLYQRALAISEKALGLDHPDVAATLNNLAGLYETQGNYVESESLHQRALTIREKALGPDHPDVAASLHNLAGLYKKQGNYGEAETLYQRAITINEKVLEPNHPDVAISLGNLAALYQAQGNYAEAEPLHQRALVIKEKTLGPNHPDVAISLNNLAGLYHAQGNYGEAEPLLQRALAIIEKTVGPEHTHVALSLNNLAELYKDQGNYGEAEPLLQRALTILEKVLRPEHPNVALSLNNLAGLYRDQGNYRDAEPLYQRALAIWEKALGPNHPNVALSLNNLAGLYRDQGNYRDAEPLYQRALAIWEKALGPNHSNVAISLGNLAGLYQDQGNYTEAIPLAQRALTIMEKTLGPNHPHVATSLNNLAALYYRQGNYGEAEPHYQRSLTIREKVLGPNHPYVATSFNNLALLYEDQGNYTEAKPFYQSALTILEKALGPNHPDFAASLNNLAGLYHAQGSYTEAIALLRQGTEIEENNLEAILTTGSERRKRAYMATVSVTTDATLSLHLKDTPNNADAAHLALTTLLRRKGRILDATSSGLAQLQQNLTPADQQLLDRLNNRRAELATLIFKGAGDRDLAQYRQQVAQLKGQADQMETQLSQRSAEFRVEAQPVTITAVRQQIPADAALVELVRYKPFNAKATGTESQWSRPRYASYVLQRQGDPQWVDLGEAEAIDNLVADFAVALRSQNLPQFQVKAAARELDKALFAPIQPLLGNARHLLLSPDSQLNRIPFAALVDEQGRYRIKTYQMTYLTAGRDLLKLQLSPISRQAPVLVADVSFQRPGDPKPGEDDKNRGQRATDFDDLLPFDPLPGTKQEIEAIAPLLPKATLLTKFQATENTVKQLKGPNILHIATHGFFLKDVPLVTPSEFLARSFRVDALPQHRGALKNPLLLSGLALAGANGLDSGGEDGVLTALEVSGLSLYGTQLVVLSACETGVGEVANGEGVYGLRRALVLAGSRSQTLSLWKVDDAGTKDWMVAYYQKLLQGVGRSEAVRQVQLQMIQNPSYPRYQHPYYWAAFIPSGDWRPLP